MEDLTDWLVLWETAGMNLKERNASYSATVGDPFLSNLTNPISPSHCPVSLPATQDPLHPAQPPLRMYYHPKEREPLFSFLQETCQEDGASLEPSNPYLAITAQAGSQLNMACPILAAAGTNIKSCPLW